jgi:hypothetical protein
VTYKILGQAAPAANTDSNLCVVGAGKQVVTSTLVVCNRSTTQGVAKFRVAVVPSGATLDAQHYLRYDELVEYRASQDIKIGMTLAAGDTVIVRSSDGNISFTLFGQEI